MDISALNNYFELYGGMAIFIVVLLEYMNLPGFPAGIIMPLAGIYAAHGGLSLFSTIAISVLAGEFGSWILYFLGMYGGNAFLKMYFDFYSSRRIKNGVREILICFVFGGNTLEYLLCGSWLYHWRTYTENNHKGVKK